MRRPSLSYPQYLLVALSVATVVGLLVAGATSTAAFGTYNRGWDGGATLQTTAEEVGAEPAVIRNTSAVTEYPADRTLTIVLAPEQPYDAQDTAALTEYVRAGGTLLVADDFGGHTNSLLAEIGAQARIDGAPLRDERHHYRSPALPVATNVSNHTLTTDVDRLTLNHGSIMRPNGATVLASSSEYAYLDENGNATLDPDERVDSYPVATVESLGDGQVIVVSDPSLFINAMLGHTDNRQFTQNILSQGDHVLFDYSHVTRLPPLAVVLLTIRDSALLQVVIGGLGIGCLGVWTARPSTAAYLRNRFRSRQPEKALAPDGDQLRAAITRAHPEWDDERIERVMQGIKTHQLNEGNDD